MAFLSNFHAFSLLAQNPCTFWQIHHKLGHLAHAKRIQNLQKYFIYPKWDTCYANFSYFRDKLHGFGHCAKPDQKFQLFLFSVYSLDPYATLGIPNIVLGQPVGSQEGLQNCPTSNSSQRSPDSTVTQIQIFSNSASFPA